MLKTVIEHYVKHGSTVTISALDRSKAFDIVDRYALLNSVNGYAAAKEFHCSVIKLASYNYVMLVFAGKARYHIDGCGYK